MEPASGAIQSGPPPPPALPCADPPPLLTWPRTVQIAVVLIVTAGIFFILGRFSLGWSRPQPEPMTANDVVPALDLNRATRAELRLLPGLGDALAQRVIEHRTRYGPFRSVDELRFVSGVGTKSLDRLRLHLFVSDVEGSAVDDTSEAAAARNTTPLPTQAAASAKKKTRPTPTTLIDVNQASKADLQLLPGIGPVMSERIVEERAKGPFKSADDLRRVKGIGPKTLDKIRPYITIETPK